MSAGDAGDRAPGSGGPRPWPRSDRATGATEFDRWLADGLAPDDHDRAAGRLLADAWRERRRALDGTAGRQVGAERRRLLRWRSPAAVVAVAVVAVVAVAAVASWPTPVVVDEAALAGAYLDAMGTLPIGAP